MSQWLDEFEKLVTSSDKKPEYIVMSKKMRRKLWSEMQSQFQTHEMMMDIKIPVFKGVPIIAILDDQDVISIRDSELDTTIK